MRGRAHAGTAAAVIAIGGDAHSSYSTVGRPCPTTCARRTTALGLLQRRASRCFRTSSRATALPPCALPDHTVSVMERRFGASSRERDTMAT